MIELEIVQGFIIGGLNLNKINCKNNSVDSGPRMITNGTSIKYIKGKQEEMSKHKL